MAQSFREAREKEFKFWKAKPVSKFTDVVAISSQIKTNEEMIKKYGSAEETIIPKGYRWTTIDIASPEIERVCTFLTKEYRSEYISVIDVDKLRWETMNIGFFVCIVDDTTNALLGCIGLTEKTLQINESVQKVCEPIYLCCGSDLRGVGMSKVMISEAFRVAVLRGYYVSSFCNTSIVPGAVSTVRYYTRPLNYKHLKANDFIKLGDDIDDDVAHDKVRIKLKTPSSIYIAEKTDSNIKRVHKLYNEYMKSFNIHHVLTLEEIDHYFFNDAYVKTILYENENGKVVDFLTYRYYDIINTKRQTDADAEYDNVIKATNIFMYSSNFINPDILLINAFKVISYEKNHLVYIPDIMGSNEVMLSPVKNGNEDTDDEDERAVYEQYVIKSSKKQFINLVNWRCSPMSQDMVSYLIFN